MKVTIPAKDVGEVRDAYRKECGFMWQLEDGIKDHGIRDLGRLVV